MNSHEISYTIHGDDMQMVSIELDPQETVIAEAGSMNWMDRGIKFEAIMGDGSQPDKGIFGKLLDVGKRVLTGESIFLTHFTNEGQGKKEVSFAAPYPGSIIPIDLNAVNGEIICQKDAFLCAAKGTEVTIAFNKKLGAGFFGGEGFILQKLKGDGLVFLHAGGTVIERELKNESLLIDTRIRLRYRKSRKFKIYVFWRRRPISSNNSRDRKSLLTEFTIFSLSRSNHPTRSKSRRFFKR